MYQSAIRSLLLGATFALLSTTACDSGAADGKAKAADSEKADTAEPAADAGAADKGEAAGETGAGETGAGETGAGETGAGETGAGETGAGETGETGEVPAAGDGAEAGEETPPKDPKPKDPKPKDPKAEAGPKLDGKPIYLKKCKSCHGVDGKGDTTIGKKVEIPSLSKTKLGKAKIAKTITDGVSGTKMKPYKEKLSSDEIQAVSSFVKKL